MTGLYESIEAEEIQLEQGRGYMSNWEKAGWLGLRTAKANKPERFYFIVSENTLFYFQNAKEEMPFGMIPLENLEVSHNGARLCLTSERKVKTIRQAKLEVVSKVWLFPDAVKDLSQWYSFIRQNCFFSPDYQRPKTTK